ncbi:hypothetical protein BDR04DRAFT_1096444 [Suillus decipiens]|nr:hypothetical protein BDR04DRAFT_1096444 [Suillus decipiens]
MPQYQLPVEPLIWIVNPSSIDIDGKILGVLKILCGLRMTVMDLIFSMHWMLMSKQVSNFMLSYDQLLSK